MYNKCEAEERTKTLFVLDPNTGETLYSIDTGKKRLYGDFNLLRFSPCQGFFALGDYAEHDGHFVQSHRVGGRDSNHLVWEMKGKPVQSPTLPHLIFISQFEEGEKFHRILGVEFGTGEKMLEFELTTPTFFGEIDSIRVLNGDSAVVSFLNYNMRKQLYPEILVKREGKRFKSLKRKTFACVRNMEDGGQWLIWHLKKNRILEIYSLLND